MAADALQALKSALADRYTIERELGRGGNATVYLARDRKHPRQVAIKVLSPELAQSVRAERFLREIEIAAGLTHPHILPLHDSGQADGFLYYVMPYVAGESLRDRLQREKQLPLADALQIAREVADALSFAHQHDVVHRDIKPENILLQAGHAVVADFGIARALTAASGQTVTQTGIAVGTPVYMSPEQGAGSKTLDGRSDIYSLGCVVYEMLAGQPPFTGETPQEILAHHALDPVPRLRKLRPEVPADLEDVILHALAKRPAERLGTAAAFAAALAAPGESARLRVRTRRVQTRRLGAAFVTALCVAGVAIALRARATASAASIGVLPLVNLSGDPANEYLSDGVSEELITALCQLPGLRVPGRTSSFFFKGKDLSLRQIGDSLGVATVLEGSLRKAGTKLRITAQLITVADGHPLWSETYDRDLAGGQDVIDVEEAIAREIVTALKVKLARGEGRTLVPHRTENPAAHALYLKGRYFFERRTPDALRTAIATFDSAIAIDSSYALAYSGVADAYVLAANFYYVARHEGYAQAKAAALRAVALDSTLAEAHVSLGRALVPSDWDWSGADREYRRAIALNPRYPLAHSWYGLMLAAQGRFADAIREGRLGRQLDPLSPAMSGTLSAIFNVAREYDHAIAASKQASELEPNWPGPYLTLGTAYIGKGMLPEALAACQRANRLAGGASPNALGLVGYLYARSGKRAEALHILAQLQQRQPTPWDQVAEVYGGLGDTDRALAALETAYETRDLKMQELSEPQWDGLRSHPRFLQLGKKMGLAR